MFSGLNLPTIWGNPVLFVQVELECVEVADAPSATRVCILGGGSFGSAVARIMAARCSSDEHFDTAVKWWVRRPELAAEINTQRTNRQYAGDTVFQDNLVAGVGVAEAVAGCGVVVLAVPHQFLDALLPEVGRALAAGAQVCSLIKSFAFDETTKAIAPLSVHIAEQLGGAEVSVLMGPNIYGEMLQDQFAEATLGYRCGNQHGGELLTRLFTTEHFSVGASEDLVGVEMCGALKNCITLGCGFCSGQGLGMNAKAAVMRRGHLEISRLAQRFFNAQAGTAEPRANMSLSDDFNLNPLKDT